METLTIQQLAPYLPYGLKIMHNGKITLLTGLDNHLGWCYRTEDKTGCTYTPVSVIKPILYSISCLTKPIEHNGETFVPIIRLAKIIAGVYNDSMDDKFVISDTGRILVKTPWDLRIEMFYKTESICWAVYDTWNHAEKRTQNQLLAFQKMAEWHINFNGIPEGLYIDKQTLK